MGLSPRTTVTAAKYSVVQSGLRIFPPPRLAVDKLNPVFVWSAESFFMQQDLFGFFRTVSIKRLFPLTKREQSQCAAFIIYPHHFAAKNNLATLNTHHEKKVKVQLIPKTRVLFGILAFDEVSFFVRISAPIEEAASYYRLFLCLLGRRLCFCFLLQALRLFRNHTRTTCSSTAGILSSSDVVLKKRAGALIPRLFTRFLCRLLPLRIEQIQRWSPYFSNDLLSTRMA